MKPRLHVAVILLALAGAWFGTARVFGPAQAQTPRERARAAVALTSGEVKVAGLAAPVEILRDTWGVPHIYAKNQDDLFIAQGFVVAQDRLWQLEIWQRKAMGRLAEVLGPEFVERDRIARLLKYRGDWKAEWESYSPDTKQIAEAFVRGINAHIAQIKSGTAKLPVEFQMLGLDPTLWTPEVVVSRMAAYPMTGNADREVARAEVVRALGAERAAVLFPTDPETPQKPADDLSLDGIDGRIVAALSRAAGEVSLDGDFAESEGSNNWTISGAKTKSGKPILANDPHRALLLPSLRYIVHLSAPGWNVIGAGEPALPGVSIGHNDRIAFGLTIFAADQQDIVVERAAQDGKVYSPGKIYSALLPVRVVEEEIRVKGEAQPRKVVLKFTENGPVIHEDLEKSRLFVLRWVGNEPGTAGYLAGLAISRARNWSGFREALKRWKLPPENFVYADVEGNIGYQASALVPKRSCNGLLPVEGDRRGCIWNGWLALDDLPHEFNPARKYVATANHNTLPPSERRMIGFDWSAPFRVGRIREVLDATRGHTIADSQSLQADVVSLPAREMKPLIELLPKGECKEGTDRSVCATELLSKWDGRMEKDSAAAVIFEVWLARLREDVYRPLVPQDVWRAASRLISLPAMIRALKEADPKIFSGDAKAARDRVLAQALDEAISELEKRLGPDMAKWRWGALHTAEFVHPLEVRRKDGPQDKEKFSRGPVERPGDGNTVNATGGGNFRQTSGASFRQVIDLSDWDNSVAINTPGQSGQPESAHYDDLLPLWSHEEYFPLAFSRKAVEENTRGKLRLIPAPK